MIKVNNVTIIDGMRVSTQEETSTQIDDLRTLVDKATQYANELSAVNYNAAYQNDINYKERVEKAQSYFLAAVKFAMAYEDTE